MDGGWSWVVLVATFTGQLLHSGAVANVGIYLVEWQQYFDVGAAAVAFIVTELSSGLLLSVVFSGLLCQRFGCRRVMMLGGIIGMSATFFASFASKLWHLHMFGVVAGIGCGISYIPSLVVVRFFFDKRLGFANGVTFAGIGGGFFIMAPLLERLCSDYGWRGALMIHAAINANYLVCGMAMRPSKIERKIIKAYNSKCPAQPRQQHVVRYSFRVQCSMIARTFKQSVVSRLFMNKIFVTLAIVSALTFGGHIAMVTFTIPKLVQDLGFSKKSASLVMSVYGICTLLARVSHGFLLDLKVISIINLFQFSLILAGISIFSPLVTSLTGQFLVLAVYGIGGGICFAIMVLICKENVPIDIASSAIGLLMAFGWVGGIASSQLLGNLSDATGSYDVPLYLSGAGFWLSAIMMAFVTKSPCFRHDHVQNTFTAEDDHSKEPREEESVYETCKETVDKGYRHVPDRDNCNVIERESRV